MILFIYLEQRVRPVVIIFTLKTHLQNLVPELVVVVVNCTVRILYIEISLEHWQVFHNTQNFCVAF